MEARALDPLSDVLRAVRLNGAHFFCVEASAPWVVEAPEATALAPRVLPASEHLISYHVVARGRCFGGLSGGERIALEEGDVIVFPHGDRHVMASARELRPRPEDQIVESPPHFPVPVTIGGLPDSCGPVERTTLVCGFLGCDRRPFNPLIATLPAVLHMRGTPHGVLAAFSRQAAEESRAQRSGAALFLTRLSELMFIEVVRRYVESVSSEGQGWLAGLRDPCVAKTLGLLHGQPARAWTLPELASAANVSRSVLAERFAAIIGQPPMQYLTQWRLQLAAGLLVDTSSKVAAIATSVGWESEAAFSRAFKKSLGMPPSEWRRRRSPP